MRQQAAVGAQRPILPNGPLPESSNHRASLYHSSPLNHTAIKPPTANGSCSSPSSGPPLCLDRSSPGKDHNPAVGGGSTSNGKVPYPQQNSLPHNCTAASLPSTSSTTSGLSHSDETWRSQHCNTTTQVLFLCKTVDGRTFPCCICDHLTVC